MIKNILVVLSTFPAICLADEGVEKFERILKETNYNSCIPNLVSSYKFFRKGIEDVYGKDGADSSYFFVDKVIAGSDEELSVVTFIGFDETANVAVVKTEKECDSYYLQVKTYPMSCAEQISQMPPDEAKTVKPTGFGRYSQILNHIVINYIPIKGKGGDLLCQNSSQVELRGWPASERSSTSSPSKADNFGESSRTEKSFPRDEEKARYHARCAVFSLMAVPIFKGFKSGDEYISLMYEQTKAHQSLAKRYAESSFVEKEAAEYVRLIENKVKENSEDAMVFVSENATKCMKEYQKQLN